MLLNKDILSQRQKTRKYRCKIVDTRWVTPTTLRFRIQPWKRFLFQAGEAIQVQVPEKLGSKTWIARTYSLASSPEEAATKYYEFCVPHSSEDPGSEYLASRKPGDVIDISGPVEGLRFDPAAAQDKPICFISAETGIAPLRSIVLSQQFQDHRPEYALAVLQFENEDEILYPRLFESLDIETVVTLANSYDSSQSPFRNIESYLKNLPPEWKWTSFEYYLCGSAESLNPVVLLLESKKIPGNQIHIHLFEGPAAPAEAEPEIDIPLLKAA